jgi:hypothetical protein
MTWASPLLTLLPVTARGPRRDGIFALWLTVRVAQDVFADPPPAERAHRRRVAALGHRLSSLMLPAPLWRALTGAIADLEGADPTAVAQALSQLVAPAREGAGPDAGDALAEAARSARSALRRG